MWIHDTDFLSNTIVIYFSCGQILIENALYSYLLQKKNKIKTAVKAEKHFICMFYELIDSSSGDDEQAERKIEQDWYIYFFLIPFLNQNSHPILTLFYPS